MNSIAIKNNFNYKADLKQKTAKPLLWIGLISIIMFFSGLTSAVVVSKSSATWISFQVPPMFLVSTFIIILSSIVFHLGLIAVKTNHLTRSKILFLITLFLGFSFAISQFEAWKELYANGIVFSGSNPAGSYFYALTALHLIHMFGGIISLMVVIVKSLLNKYNPQNILGIQLSITYWHFLTALWVYLFLFLKLIA